MHVPVNEKQEQKQKEKRISNRQRNCAKKERKETTTDKTTRRLVALFLLLDFGIYIETYTSSLSLFLWMLFRFDPTNQTFSLSIFYVLHIRVLLSLIKTRFKGPPNTRTHKHTYVVIYRYTRNKHTHIHLTK